MINREACRKQILDAVRDMARDFPGADYCSARAGSGLLGKIRNITQQAMPTAKQCWEYVGLDRTRLVDEFEFTQREILVSHERGA